MKVEKLKSAVSKYLTSQGIDVLDMFYKMPCDSCKTIDTWDMFSLTPDLIVSVEGKKFLVFIITNLNDHQRIKEYIIKHKGIYRR